MSDIRITGGQKLFGEVRNKGAKNSALPLIAAAILTEEEVVLYDVPDITDVRNMLRIVDDLGAKTSFSDGILHIRSDGIDKNVIEGAVTKELRSSFFLLGSVLSRFESARVAYPGGCDIGLRPIDLHVKSLRDLGYAVEEKGGEVHCKKIKKTGGQVFLDYPSVGATENVILASVKSEGEVTLHNAACEPEIVDLQTFLRKMGANVEGAGTPTVRIRGVRRLRGGEHTVIPDRIVAGTYAIAAAVTGGEIVVKNAPVRDMQALLSKLAKTSCIVNAKSDMISIKGNGRPTAVAKLPTRPHPGFPTDLQAPMMTLLSVSEGVSVVCEQVFENRFRHVGELVKMGADILVDGRSAVVKGVPRLHGAEVYAQDLRGGAALVLAGLNAEGETVVHDAEHIDRGYERIEQTLESLGAEIRRT